MCCSDIEQIAAGAVAQDEEGSCRFNIPGFEMNNRRVVDGSHDFEFSLEAHLDALFRRSAARTMLAHFDGHQSLQVGFDGGRYAARSVFFAVVHSNLAGREHDPTEGSFAELFYGAPSSQLIVLFSPGLEVFVVRLFRKPAGGAIVALGRFAWRRGRGVSSCR